MPLDRHRQPVGLLLDQGSAVASVQDDGLDVVGHDQGAVDLCLDVPVERVVVLVVGVELQGQVMSVREGSRSTWCAVAELGRAQCRVREAERRPVEHLLAQTQVGRPKRDAPARGHRRWLSAPYLGRSVGGASS